MYRGLNCGLLVSGSITASSHEAVAASVSSGMFVEDFARIASCGLGFSAGCISCNAGFCCGHAANPISAVSTKVVPNSKGSLLGVRTDDAFVLNETKIGAHPSAPG